MVESHLWQMHCCSIGFLLCFFFFFSRGCNFLKKTTKKIAQIFSQIAKHKSAQCTRWILISGKIIEAIMLFSTACRMRRGALASAVVMKSNSKGGKNGVRAACENHRRLPFVVFAKKKIPPVLSSAGAEKQPRCCFCCLHSCCRPCRAVDFLFKRKFPFPFFAMKKGAAVMRGFYTSFRCLTEIVNRLFVAKPRRGSAPGSANESRSQWRRLPVAPSFELRFFVPVRDRC